MGEGSHADDRMMFTCAKWHRDAMEVLAAGMLACRERQTERKKVTPPALCIGAAGCRADGPIRVLASSEVRRR